MSDRLIHRYLNNDPHPLSSELRRLIEKHGLEKLRAGFYRPRDGLVFAKPKVYINVDSDDSGSLPMSGIDWDPCFEGTLLSLRIKAPAIEYEVSRFAYLLIVILRDIENRYGSPVFNTSLGYLLCSKKREPVSLMGGEGVHFYLVRELGPFFEENKGYLVKLLQKYREESIDDSCLKEIEKVLAAMLLTFLWLGYDSSECRRLMRESISEYLDEKFHVTKRKLLGLNA